MKRKSLWLVVAIICFCLSVTLIACNEAESETHTHEFGNYVDFDENNHVATCTVCNEKVYSAHVYGKWTVSGYDTSIEKATCTVCGHMAVRNVGSGEQHTHNFGEFQDFNNDYHIAECDSCDEKQYEAHRYDNWNVCLEDTTKERAYCTVCRHVSTRAVGAEDDKFVELYAINDFHGAVDRMSKTAGYLKSLKNSNPNTVIINSGDMFQGSIESNSNYGKLLTDCMAEVGFDSFTYGNHEFDWGLDNLRQLSKYSQTPFLGANIYKWNAQTRTFGEFASDIAQEYVIKQLPNGIRVGIIGVIGKDQITSISSNLVQDIGFKDPKDIIPDLSRKLRNEEGCQVVVVSLHASQTVLDGATAKFNIDDYADAVFCGHTHQAEYETTSGGTPFIQGGANGYNVSKIVLKVSGNEVTCQTLELQPYSYSWKNDNNVDEIIDRYAKEYASDKSNVPADKVLVSADDYLDKNGEIPRIACRAIAEFAIERGYEDIALAVVNQARANIYEGNVTYRDLYKALPFDNQIYIAEVTGDNLISLARNNYIWRVTPNAISRNKTYKIAVIDYLLYHQNSNRVYDYTETAFENGRTPVLLTKADGSTYNYREITRDFLLKQTKLDVSLYDGTNAYTDRTGLTGAVSLPSLTSAQRIVTSIPRAIPQRKCSLFVNSARVAA